MKTMNRVFLIGYLGQKPEITLSKSGRPYTRLSVATHRSWMTADDRRQEQTEWHSVFLFGPLAETCCSSLDKGALVFVEGALSYWKVKEKEYRNAIHGTEVRFLNSLAKPRAGQDERSGVDNPEATRNHNAVAQLA